MEEKYICSCGNDTWFVYAEGMKCTNTECNKKYQKLLNIIDASYFNTHREDMEFKEE